MEAVRLVARNGEAVAEALERGEVLHLDTASEEITDEFLLFAINSGLLDSWADSFPDPRKGFEISLQVILACEIAARFAAIYSQRKSSYVLRSARLLGALGYSLEVLDVGDGISSRGTSSDALYCEDVLRKLLGKIEKKAELTSEDWLGAQQAGAEVKVRDRQSRRAVKQKGFNELEAAARSHSAAREVIFWYNQQIGPSLLEYAQMGEGRRIHLLDTTKIEVALSTGSYECSGVVADDEAELHRGYKLASLRTLLDNAGLMSQLEVGQIQTHDVKLCAPLLLSSKLLRAGDLVIMDRGLIDGETITQLKQEKKVDVIVPLRSDMNSYLEAVALAEKWGKWEDHPSRKHQQIAFVEGVEQLWEHCLVKLNACVIRFYNKKRQKLEYIVIVTTDLSLNARSIVKHYEERPEIEQDYEQLKSGGWMLEKLSTTRYSQIVFYLVTVVLSYSLYQLFANTQAGGRFAKKTRQAIAFEQMKTRRTHVIVYAGAYFEIYETLRFVHMVLRLSPEVQGRLRHWLEEHLPQLAKRE